MSNHQKIIVAIIVFTVCLINSIVCENMTNGNGKSSDVIGMWFN